MNLLFIHKLEKIIPELKAIAGKKSGKIPCRIEPQASRTDSYLSLVKQNEVPETLYSRLYNRIDELRYKSQLILREKTINVQKKFIDLKFRKINIADVIQTHEISIIDATIEKTLIISPKSGRLVVKPMSGTAHATGCPEPFWARGTILSHNHPDKFMDFPLNIGDIERMLQYKFKEMRCVTPNGKWFSFKLPERLKDEDYKKFFSIYNEVLALNWSKFIEIDKKLPIKLNMENGEKIIGFNSEQELKIWKEYASIQIKICEDLASKLREAGYEATFTNGEYAINR